MKKLLLLAFSCLLSLLVFSQQLTQQDLSKVDVDRLTDKEILYYYNRLQQSGLSLDQAAQIAASRGMPQEEIGKLRSRVQLILSGQTSTQNQKNNSANQNLPDTSNNTVQDQRTENTLLAPFADELVDTRVFGSEIFRSSSLSFEPNLRIATPANYVLGPDDELNIDVYGYSEEHYKLKVSPEGNVYIPNAGPVFVSGITVDEAAAKIRAKLAATIYKAINSGATKVQVTLGNIRSIRVTVIGQAKKPGTYTVSSLATAFNALYVCGGPNFNGSYRDIELIRDNKILHVIDLYNFLLKGSLADNILLKDQDVIRIPYYQSRVTVDGEVKRPGIFELQPGDDLQTVMNAAGGFSDSAYRSSINISQITNKERSVATVDESQFNTYQPHGGDLISVGKVLERYTNRMEVKGAVMRPGFYELTSNLTLKQLIAKADGLREDAFLKRGIITRLKSDLTVEAVSFDVSGVVNGTSPDIALQKEDVITISSIFDLRDKYTIDIQGQVRKPGTYEYKDSISIKDLIFEAGGFTEAATAKRIEIARRVTNGDASANYTEIAKVVQVDAEKDLQTKGGNYYLQPFDVVIVRNNPGYFTQKTVYVFGEVTYPGPYVINSIDEKLSSIITRSGGFKNTADPSAASLKRQNRIDETAQLKTKKIEKLAVTQTVQDSAAVDSLAKEALQPYDLIGINLNEVMDKPGITNDLILEDGDIIFIPKKNQAVKVRGEVLFPTQFAFRGNKDMKYYINKAGGFSSNAVKRKSFVLGANGNARKVHGFFIFKTYPEIYAGDEIYVPKKPDYSSHRLSTAEAIGITSAIASLAGVIIAILQVTK